MFVIERRRRRKITGYILHIFALDIIEIDTLCNFFSSLAGSYAQLTLLGQPKLNSISTQKIIPGDNNQNGRVPFRTNTQTGSIPERSNSTTSTHSLQTTFDTKKAKENYDRIVKQLEV